MKRNLSFGRKSCRTAKAPLRFFLLGATLGCAGHCFATGYFGPDEYLTQGGKNVVATPEFYWELETKRLAKDFHPTEKPIPVVHTTSDDGVVDPAPMQKATADADTSDFADAIKRGEVKPPDAAKATKANDDARTAIAATTPTAPTGEFDSEFADYHKGAYAYRLGPDHYDEAQKAWEALLNRPATERHYRTLWATFMLGKLAMKKGDAAAVKWFEKTRELAKQGFADSLGMAADSYGWEGRSEWKQGHPEKAAPLYLAQLALGDESAIVSLKALIPDRVSVDGMLNYEPTPTLIDGQTPDPAMEAENEKKQLAGLKAAAPDPLLRRLITAHILAAGWGSQWSDPKHMPGDTRSGRWLKMIDELKLITIEDAEYLGWLAYTDGDYKEAQRWLDLCKTDSAAANWLRAKLQLRAGQLDGAVQSLAKAMDTLRSRELYTGWKDGAYSEANQKGPGYISWDDDDGSSWSMEQSSSGDLGGMHLEKGDFVQAMDVLLKGGLWEDASYIAERVLTADELKAYVDKLPAPAPTATPPTNDTADDKDYTQKLRNLLGRRLVREDRYAEAATYLTAPYDKIVQKYAAALKDGADESLPKLKRAQAWFTAAWMARYDGMELMGTEVSPDSFVSGGDFEGTDMAQERLAGSYKQQDWVNGVEKDTTERDPLPASAAERQRLLKNKIEPDVRYHYRYVAAALAMKAAALMNDNTEELADVVNTAGNWIANADEKLGDKYFQVIDRRCSKTTIGKQASAKHWFVDATGPWSTDAQTAYDAMHKELGDSPTEGK